MNSNLCRHVRLAGCVAIWVGLFLSNWKVMLLGNLVLAVAYMWSIAKIEKYLESITEVKEDASNNERS